MNKQNDNLYIEQQEKESNLYFQLQQKTLEELQRLSGKVWTDFNLHDPGVTLTDIQNYALTELDYRLGFPLQDYLTAPGRPFDPEAYGFYLPAHIFPVSPVTADDYRKYMLNALPAIDNIWFIPHTEEGKTCRYMVYAEKSAFNNQTDDNRIKQSIRDLYYRKRNLSEELEDIRFIERKPLFVHGDIHITSDVNSTQMLAEILWEIQAFLADYPAYYSPEEMELQGVSPDEWMEGPLKNGLKIEFPLHGNDTETELYYHLLSLKGVKAIHSFHLEDAEGNIVNVFDRFYSIDIPDSREKMYLKVWVGNTEVNINLQQLPLYLRTYYFRYKGKRIQPDAESALSSLPEGTYRPIYEQEPLRNDFPHVYGINRYGLSSHEPARRKAQAEQLKAYLLLFDLIFVKGLDELEELRHWMQQTTNLPEGPLLSFSPSPYMESLLAGLVDPERAVWNKRMPLRPKEQLLDMWDKLYGEDSNPLPLRDFHYYDEEPKDALERRILFLRQVPAWGEKRFVACNIYAPISPENVPGIKAYFCSLLGWERDERKPTYALLTLYQLNGMSDREYFEDKLGKLTLLEKEMQDNEEQEYVPFRICREDINLYYAPMKKHLPVLYYKTLFESLLHCGISLDNYRIIPHRSGYILALNCKDKANWVDLGWFADKERLIKTANRLRHFLVQLNRRSETLYIVEHIYFPQPEAFALTVVLPGWSARTSIHRFRKICEELLLSHLPAHLKIHFRWLDFAETKSFETLWYHWRTLFAAGEREQASLYMERIKRLLAQ